MLLSRETIPLPAAGNVLLPDENIFTLPEKVLQFGTGVLLRGLPDYFIDKANRSGLFNGRIVIVKSTGSGDITSFKKQDALYTVCIRGRESGRTLEENIIVSSVSRVLSANHEWDKILAFASSPHMEIIISNTTEVGIQFIEEDVFQEPPASFPGKLLRFLHQRYTSFHGSASAGMVIMPTELIADNGKKLQSVVIQLAHANGLEEGFVQWIKDHNHFCNSLVDRIVPGRPDERKLMELRKELQYEDDLLLVAEPYALWAIQGNSRVKNILSFAAADKRIIIAEDIDGYRELKLRLLNGTHTLTCGLAHLAGFTYVVEAMENKIFASFIASVMLSEIALAIPYNLPPDAANNFGLDVLERFTNPYIKHQWLNITLNYTSKMKSRVVPVLVEYFRKHGKVPGRIALGFAAYLLFMKAVKFEDNKYYGKNDSGYYHINDDHAGRFYTLWQNKAAEWLVPEVLGDKNMWDEDLSLLPGFQEAVTAMLNALIAENAVAVLSGTQQEMLHKPVTGI